MRASTMSEPLGVIRTSSIRGDFSHILSHSLKIFLVICFILFKKYYLGTYSVPGTIVEYTTVNKTDAVTGIWWNE